MMAASNTWIRSQVSQSGTNTGKRKVRRVLIVDDHPIVRQGLRRVMENEDDLTVCGEAETARDARTAIKELSPDVVIADISLKQGDGIELVRDVRAHYPQLPILVLSMHDETIYAERMLSAGANGYIMKQAASEQFLVVAAAGARRRHLRVRGRRQQHDPEVRGGRGVYFRQSDRSLEQSRAADSAYDRQGHEHPRDRAFAELEHQDGGIASAAHQAQTESHHRDPVGAVRGELVYRPGGEHVRAHAEGGGGAFGGCGGRLAGNRLHAAGKVDGLAGGGALGGAFDLPDFGAAAQQLHVDGEVQGFLALQVGANPLQ